MQLTGVLSPVQFISTSTLAVERPVLAGRILPSFYVGNSVLLARWTRRTFKSSWSCVECSCSSDSSPSYRDLCRLYLWTQQCFSKERAVDVETELIWTGSKNTFCSFLFQVSQIRQVSHSLTLQQEKVTWLVSRLLSIMTLTSLFQTKMADLPPTMLTQPVKPVVPDIWWWKNHAGYFPCE